MSAPTPTVATAQARSQSFEIAPSAQLQPVSVSCAGGEQLIGGGYATASRDLRVISSYPQSPTLWTVVVWNPSKNTVALAVHAQCLRGADGRTRIQSASGRPPSVRADCPNGTVVTGGGYLSSFAPRAGGAAVTGSYPSAGNGWTVPAARVPGEAAGAAGTQKVEVFAVCLEGRARTSIAGATVADVAAGTPRCVSVPQLAQQCTFPRTVEQKLGCPAGEVFSSSGYQVTVGTLPEYSVLRAGGEQFAVDGVGRDDSVMAVRLTPVCLTWPADPAPTALRWVLPVGAGLLLLLLLLLALLLLRSRSKPPGPGPGLAVTVKSQRSTFRFDRLREVP